MGLALVVVEEHAGAAMQLGNDDALGAVHDERTVVRHQREFAKEHRLFGDVALELLGAGRVLLVNAQLHLHAQGRGIGEPAELALLDVEHGATEFVALEIEDCVPAVTCDGEHALERRLQTRIVATILMQVTLQEFLVGVQLDRQQVRHLQDARTLAEILADALLLCKGIGHLSHLCFCYWTLDSKIVAVATFSAGGLSADAHPTPGALDGRDTLRGTVLGGFIQQARVPRIRLT